MKALVSAAVVVAVSLSLAGCGAPAKSGGSDLVESDLTLAATKAPAQLLRNEILTRFPEEQIESQVSEDASKGCEGDDKVRSWQSSTNVELTGTSETAFVALIRSVRVSFEDTGWAWKAANSRPEQLQGTLTSKKTSAKIFINAAAPSGGANPTLLVTVSGPCVLTGGAESEEVLKLENRE